MQVSVEKLAGSNIPGLEMTKLVSDSSFALAIFMFITIMEWDCILVLCILSVYHLFQNPS